MTIDKYYDENKRVIRKYADNATFILRYGWSSG